MSDWPEGWTRGNTPRPDSARDEATQVLRRPQQPQPGHRTPPLPPPARRRSSAGRSRRRLGAASVFRRTLLVLLVVVALLLGLVLFFFSRVGKVDALRDYDGRPAATPGQDWLLVGSD